MKRQTALLLIVLAVGLLGAHAAAAGLAVIVDPADEEWIAAIEDLGFNPVTSMDELLRQYDPATCAVGIAYSGLEHLDDEWLADFFNTGATLVAFGWDLEEAFYGETGRYGPDLITVAYSFDGTPITYEVASERELNDVLTFACFYSESWSDFGSMPFDFDEIDIEAIIEEILAEAGPFLAVMDQFLQPEWEYHVAPTTVADLDAHLNDLGAEGWELVTITGEGLIFKRRAMNAERLIEIIFSLAQEMMELAAEQGAFF